ncbi:DUF6079 family protein [Catellatospora sp. NPDC049609]|uniref:DUF6079 family protein n=1 Tax=Catellatospora sp. NPDC049609 TaxID=3155505 RepID=UPI003434BAA7
MSILLRDIIEIPETAGADDYVLRLTEGVGKSRLARTVKEYVVTDALAEAFDSALGLIASAIQDDQSRAAFLSGSFGSGKSHFMAVLYALLGGEPAARAIPELQPTVARHDPVLAHRKVLRLAFHFLEARSIEETILGGYVAQIQALHPGCDLPAVHRSDAVLADGERMRLRHGDDAFLAGLNEHAAVADEWSGVLEGDAPWTAESYDAARTAAPGSEARQRLVSALVRTYFTAFTQTGEFVSLDEGLDAMSRHAKGLGYDAIVMFLDELVLWLSFAVRDREFFGREAQKITKLVESGLGERAIPIVSFVARQLDLRRYFVDMGGGAGAEQDALDKAFRHQEGRFLPIVLGDDNLPYVAQKRLLQPKGDAARAALDDAFQQLDRRPEVWDVLLDGVNTDDSHRGSDQLAFRRTYPFSPALVSTLRTLASAMQRDRTALKVMQQLLVRQRDHLTIDDVVPVGDVFDLVVDGNQALTPEMAGRFKNARTLYQEKLLPELLREHKLAGTDLAGLPREHPFWADDRLVKTLVLSSVAPEVPALKELTPSRLAALNHGSITAPAFRGREGELALTKLRRWQSPVPEIQITGDTRNPVVRIRIAEVDYESVVERAKGEDNDGRRRETLKRLIWDELELKDIDGDAFGVSRQARIWRGSRREIEVVFGNVRDRGWLTDGAFEAGPDTWRFVVDYPFDEDGHSSLEDLNRIDALRVAGKPIRTVVWVPHFLSAERRRELGRLVILDWLLGGSGDRWTAHSDHLAEADRVQARIILETQRESLRQRLRHAVQEAYGAATATPGTLERLDGHDRVLFSLHREFDPAAPVGHDLAAAFGNLVEQAFAATFPGHPRFEPEDREVTRADLAAVLAAVEAARQDPDGRAFIDPAKREAVRRVANPLGVGHMGETHFLFGSDRFRWDMLLSTAMGRDGMSPADPVEVRRLRSWINAVSPPAGLRPEVTDLITCAWAVLHTRAWYRYNAPVVPAPTPGTLTADMELRPEPLPAAGDWEAAVARAAVLFGTVANPYLTGQAVTELTQAVNERAAALKTAAAQLVTDLERIYQRFTIAPGTTTGRLATARSTQGLVAALTDARDRVALVEALARYELAGTTQAAAKSLTSAQTLVTGLASFPMDRLRPVQDAAGKDSGERAVAARGIVQRLRDAVIADELAQGLLSALKRAEDEAFRWALETTGDKGKPGPDHPDDGKRKPARGSHTVASHNDLDETVAQLRAFAAERAGRPFTVEWQADE